MEEVANDSFDLSRTSLSLIFLLIRTSATGNDWTAKMIPAKTIKPEKNVETLLSGTFSHASGEPFSCVRDRLRQVPYATHVSPPVIHKPVFVTCPLGIHGRDPSDITIEIHLVTGTERSCPVHVSLGESRPGMVNPGICCLQRRKAVPEFVNLLFSLSSQSNRLPHIIRNSTSLGTRQVPRSLLSAS